MNRDFILDGLNTLFPNPKCELIYNKDYELLIATMLSAQSTDKRVNMITPILFSKYDIFKLEAAPLTDIKKIIKPVGMYQKKSVFVKQIAERLTEDCNGIVPNDRNYLETLPGVGRKTTNVVLANLYNVPSFAVDTHVSRISKIFGIAKETDDVLKIEKKLCKYFNKDTWNKVNDQMILFGRYICKSRGPKCSECPFEGFCNKTKS